MLPTRWPRSFLVGLGLVAGCAAHEPSPVRLTQGEPRGPVVDTVLPPGANVTCVELAAPMPEQGTVVVLVRAGQVRELVAWDLVRARLLVRVPLAEEASTEPSTCASEASPRLRDLLRADDEALSCAVAPGAPLVACALRGALRLVR